MSTPSAVTIINHEPGQTIASFNVIDGTYIGGGFIHNGNQFSIATPSGPTTKDESDNLIGQMDSSLGIEQFPATAWWWNDYGMVLIEAQDGNLYIVQSIDLEFLPQNDAWIDKHFNPVCLGCWYYTCQTILREGDTVGDAYSVRVVADDQCEAPFHEEED